MGCAASLIGPGSSTSSMIRRCFVNSAGIGPGTVHRRGDRSMVGRATAITVEPPGRYSYSCERLDSDARSEINNPQRTPVRAALLAAATE